MPSYIHDTAPTQQQGHVAAAAYQMKHAGATALIVLDARTDQPAGIITEADIARAVSARTIGHKHATLQKLTDQGFELTQRCRSGGGDDIHESRSLRRHDALVVLPAAERDRKRTSLVSHPGHASEPDRELGAELRDVRRTDVPDQLDDHIQGLSPVLARHARRAGRKRRSSSAMDNRGRREGDPQGGSDRAGSGAPRGPRGRRGGREWRGGGRWGGGDCRR